MVNNRIVTRILVPLVIVAGGPAATAILLRQFVGSPIEHADGGAGLPPCHAHDECPSTLARGDRGDARPRRVHAAKDSGI